jgi:hypothetical protein
VLGFDEQQQMMMQNYNRKKQDNKVGNKLEETWKAICVI